ncbi:signal transduction histidine kinase [Novosphingobium aromaticivorans DSM 12444]|uniref:histidine kinase n=2 Tax=Novosphingobium aromaticivorans TaxID=48935 RepID=Q2G8Z6_NOVAD|nr:signal transduction histidine kinase [Novosphingobium aromaticivorans DSM 12444]
MDSGKRARGQFVRALIERDRGPVSSLAWMAGLLLVPTALRMSLDTGSLGLPFLTFWPSILIAALVLELRFAAIFALVTAFFAQRTFGGGAWFHEVTTVRVVFFLLFATSAGMIVGTGTMLRRVLRELGQVNERQQRYNTELRHRVRNMLMLIQALASRGPKATSPMDFYKEFSLRIEGLAEASDLLQIGAETEGRLPQLARQTVAPFDRDGRIRLSGEPCILPADSCIPLIMALHELCTNAIKHGALSNERGRVELSWFIGSGGSTLFLLWTEKGGPQVKAPDREGLGTRLLMPQPGLDGVELNFDPDGVWCEFRIEGAKALTVSA